LEEDILPESVAVAKSWPGESYPVVVFGGFMRVLLLKLEVFGVHLSKCLLVTLGAASRGDRGARAHHAEISRKGEDVTASRSGGNASRSSRDAGSGTNRRGGGEIASIQSTKKPFQLLDPSLGIIYPPYLTFNLSLQLHLSPLGLLADGCRVPFKTVNNFLCVLFLLSHHDNKTAQPCSLAGIGGLLLCELPSKILNASESLCGLFREGLVDGLKSLGNVFRG
jgi:hypothetical protein